VIRVTIDPGKHALGWALWIGGVLIACGLSRSNAPGLAAMAADHALSITRGCQGVGIMRVDLVTVEHMEAGNERVPPQDLIEVEAVGCLTAAAVTNGQVALLPPSTWKGSLPKQVIHDRNRDVLSAGERLLVDRACAKAPRTNWKEILDAVGIGLFDLKRTSRAGCARR